MWSTDSGSSRLGAQVDLEKSESRILRIARGSGTHPDEVRGLLKMHKHFEKVFGKMGKNIKGDVSKVKQLQVRRCLGRLGLVLRRIRRGSSMKVWEW